MDSFWQLFSPNSKIDPSDWLVGSTATLAAMLVLSATVAAVGFVLMFTEHRHAGKTGFTTLIAGVVALGSAYVTQDYLRTMNRWENLAETTLGRIEFLTWNLVASTVIGLILVFLGYYVASWNSRGGLRAERQASFAGVFMIGAGMVFAIHVTLLWMRMSNEQKALDTKRICDITGTGVCKAKGDYTMLPSLPVMIWAGLAIGLMLVALVGAVYWRKDQKRSNKQEPKLTQFAGRDKLV